MGDIVNVLEAWEQKRETGLGHCPNFKVCNIDQTDAAKGPQCTPWPHFSSFVPKPVSKRRPASRRMCKAFELLGRQPLKVKCPHCGGAHEISVRETYLNSALHDAAGRLRWAI
jgi:hypothetical protein